MHIAFVTTTFPPDNGWDGIGSYVFQVSQALITLGHEVTVICGFDKEPYETHHNGLHIFRHLNTKDVNIFQIQNQVAELLPQIISKYDLDIVEFPEYSSLGLVFQKQHPNFPTLVKLHADAHLCQLGNHSGIGQLTRDLYYRFKPNIFFQMEKETAALAHAVVSPSQCQIQQCLKRNWLLPKNRAIVANPFEGWYKSIDWLDKDYTKPRVLSLGRLDFLKGASLMPDIFRAVWREIPETCFEILGQSIPRKNGSNWGEWILSQIPKNKHEQIVIHGGIPYLELPQYLASHSIAFFASTWESFGYTHVECMYSGIACVIGSNGGAKELGIHGISCLNASRKVKDIANKLLTLLENPSLRQNMGYKAREHVLKEYSAINIAEQMIEVYQGVISEATI